MTPGKLREELGGARERLLRAIAGVTEEQFKRRPPAAEGEAAWSIAEVLSHLLAIERLWAGRITVALSDPEREITPSPPEAHEAGARAGARAPAPQLIHGLLAARREVGKALDRIEADGGSGLALTVWHPRLAEKLSVEWMFEKIAGHEREHVEQVEALRPLVGAKPRPEASPEPAEGPLEHAV